MSELTVVQKTELPLTRDSLARELRSCGLAAGQIVLVHSSMSKLGWIPGGAEAVIQSFLDVLGQDGTLMMPSFSSDNSDPASWQNPPVPESWWPIIREWTPAFNPATTPTRMMGAIPELFRTWPGALRSDHPITSFAARGPAAAHLTSDHTLEADLGDQSPLGKLYELDGNVLLLGVGHMNNTSLHLAEFRSDYPGKRYLPTGSAMLFDGKRRWVKFDALDLRDDDFGELGAAFDQMYPDAVVQIGNAESRFFKQRDLVDFAVQWMRENR